MSKNNRAYSVSNILTKKFELLEFDETWKATLGKPDKAFSATIWGNRSNGKTSAAMSLAKQMTKFGSVAYNSGEEGISHTIQMAVERNYMESCENSFILLDKEPFMDMWERLKKPKSPKCVFIDSIQTQRITRAIAEEFMNDMKKRKKSVIWISHAKGKEPKGDLADYIAYMSDLKLFVQGFKLFPDGRLNGGGEPFTIWPEKAAKYWNEII